MKYLFLCYPRWTTCKKAKDWLDRNNIQYEERNIKEENPNEAELTEWISRSNYPIKRFFNTSGSLYRELNVKEKLKTTSEKELIKLLASDGMLVKRPILVGEDIVLVAFKEEEWTFMNSKQ